MKKAISVLLAFVLCFCVFLPAFAAQDASRNVPIITVPGTSNTHILNAEGDTIVPDSFDLGAFLQDKEAMAPLLAEFAKATVTDRWDTYSDLLAEALSPIWAPAIYDNAGMPQHGDHPTWSWNENSIPKKTSGFHEGDYYFRYDWRMDPLETAAQLDAYIDGVKKATGAAKVALVGRCYGACVVAAYLTVYGADKVDTCIMYMPMAAGVETEEALFTGDIKLDADTVRMYGNYWLTQERPIADGDVNDLVAALVDVVYYSGGMHMTTLALSRLIERFKDHILPRLLRASYATYPGYWAMIGQERYEQAKGYVFRGTAGAWSALIDRIDRYHYTVQTPLFDTLDRLQAAGMKLNVIAKYGVPTYPYFEGSDYLTDSSNSLTRQSFGAVTSTMDTVLPESYRAGRIAEGKGAYLSADGKVDASACRYPDQTWFFKDIKHLDMDAAISDLMTLCAEAPAQFTVHTDERFPQFMHKNEAGQVLPLTPEDPGDRKWDKKDPLRAFIDFFRALMRALRDLFTSAGR